MTIFNLPVASILHRETIFEDNFSNNFSHWEQTDNDQECSFVSDGHYWMENRSDHRWMYYSRELPKRLPDHFVINAEIELLEHQNFGQFGLVWGFEKPLRMLNRFAVSAEANRFTVMRFEKDHQGISHRFSKSYTPEPESGSRRFLSIMQLSDYCYFFLHHHQRPVYICHRTHLPVSGSGFGFYVEPGILMRAKQIKVQRLVVSPDFDGHGWMPMGSELINGN